MDMLRNILKISKVKEQRAARTKQSSKTIYIMNFHKTIGNLSAETADKENGE